MATISGRVVFDRDRSSTITAGDTGLANVPVVLQNTLSNVGLVVLTDANGNYSFLNVPNGSYRIVEAFGTPGGVPTPGDFSTAGVIPVPTATVPPISFATNPPPAATNLDCTVPNTILITVTGADITNQNILNGPVIYTPIEAILDSCTTLSPINLITDASNGTFGSFPPGTPANTGPATAPYPNVTPDFTYVVPDPTKFTPIDGEYTVQNIMNDAMSNVIGAWWRIADHTTGNETGRMMVVNGFNPGAVFFRSTVPVTPNTFFLFTTWILNLFDVPGFPPDQLGVRILDQFGNVLFQQSLGELVPEHTDAPEWKQIGTALNSENNTQITVEFFSEGEAVIGNDYAIDDVALQEIAVPRFVPVKTISTPTAFVGEIVTYTVQITNTCTSPLTNVFFSDIIPVGLLFQTGSVVVNGVSQPGSDPNVGFTLPNIPGGTTTSITFQVRVEGIPTPNPVNNMAIIDYSYTPVEGGIPLTFAEESNQVPLLVLEEPGEADLAIVKSSNQATAVPGEQFTYTLAVSNLGPADAQSVLVTDNIPSTILNPQFSLDGGADFFPWTGSLNLGTIEAQGFRIILIRGTVSPTATGVITNTATVSSPTPDPNLANNTSTLETPVSPVVVEADIAVVKTSNQATAVPGQPFTYTLTVTNFGPDASQSVLVTDNIPSTILNPQFSVNGGVFQPWTGSFNLGTLNPGAVVTITITGTVSPSATGVITNTATVSSPTPDPNLANNTSTLETPITPVVVEADIAVVKTSNQATAVPGQPFTYTLTVTNFGPDAAQSVLVTDNIPASILNPQFSVNGGSAQPWTGSLNLGTLNPGTVVTITITGTVSPTATGLITNTATVSSPTPDPNLANNTSTLETPVSPVVVEADMAIVKQSSQSAAVPGEPFSYILTVTNFGPDAAQNVLVTDTIPPSILNPQFSINGGPSNPWTGSLNLGTVAPGEVITITITGTVSPSATGSITNTAIVSSSTPDPDPSNNSSTITTPVSPVVLEADVSVVKTASQNPVSPGGVITYTLLVSNAGPDDAQNVVVNDVLSPSIINPLFSIDGGVTFNPWLGFFDIGTLPAGTSRTIIITGTVAQTATGCINNAALVTSTTPDPNLLNNISSICTEVEAVVPAEADISVVKTAIPDPVAPGGLLTYTLVVANAGPAASENVLLTDSIPSSITGAQFSTDGGVTFNPWPGFLSLGTLQAGASLTILIRGTVLDTATGTITNTANVSSPTPDPNPFNNTSTVVTEVSAVPGEADVSVVKTSSPNPVSPGGVLTYTIVVANAGPSDAQNVVLTDVIPSSITGPQFSIDGGVTFNPWPGSFSIGTLPAGASTTILIRGTVIPNATGCINNTAIATSTTPDPNPLNNVSSVCTEVQAVVPVEADVSVVKTAIPNPVAPGGEIVYTIVVANAGPADAQNVVLTDSIPPTITGPQFSTDGGVTFNPWPGFLSIGTLPAGTSRTILIRGTVIPNATGTIINTANVTSTTPDPNPGNNTSTVVTEVSAVPGEADVSVVKTSSPNPVSPGGVLTYTIVVANAGPSDAQNVVLTDVIPSSITGPQFSIDGGVTFNPWPGSFSIGTLPAGTSMTILIRGTVIPNATGCINNTAIATSTTPDPNPLNNVSSVCTEVQAVVPGEADISVVKTASPNPVAPGGVLTYTLVVANAGPAASENVVLTDSIPPTVTGPQFSTDGGVTFNPWPGFLNLGTLQAGASLTILIRGTVIPNATGTITNTANVTSTTPDPNPFNNTSTVVTEVSAVPGEADVSVVKTSSPNPVSPGGVLTYTIVVSNAGPADAQNVVLTDNIPSSILNPQFSTDGGVTFNPWPGSFSIGTLPAGTSTTILIRGTVSPNATGCINNTAIVTSTTPDPNPLNNVSSVCTEVQAVVPVEADVSVVKTSSPNPVSPGGVLTYTIVVSNAGPADAQNVVLTDNIPSSILNPQFSTDGGVTFNPWPGSFSIGTLPAGTSRTILIRGTVSPNATGCINNTAIVTSTTPDPNPLNNISSICTEVAAVVPVEADVSVVKKASPNPVFPGETLTYTIVVSNAGPADAQNVVLVDNVSSSIINPEFSVDGGVTFNPWLGSLSIGTLPAGASRTIIIRGTVSSRAKECIANGATVSSTTPDPNLLNNTSAICVEVRERKCRCKCKCNKCFECDECKCNKCCERDECKCNRCFERDECRESSRCNKRRRDRNCNCERDDFW